MYYLVMRSLEERQALIAFLKSRGILSVFHYVPLHLSSMGKSVGGENPHCPVCETKSDRLVRLPFFKGLEPARLALVVEAVMEFESRLAQPKQTAIPGSPHSK
jgi:dTDP-4-amino-4,6-dideoxygalactose transaminase